MERPPVKKPNSNCVRRWSRFAAVAALLTCSIAHAVSTNYELKAAYIARFTEFIEWPASAAHHPDTPRAFTICVYGNDPILGPLEQLPQLLKDTNRRIEIRRVDRPQDSVTCDIVFVPYSANEHVAQITAHTEHKPILVINEIQGVPAHGQLISLYTEGERLRIEIHLRAAQDAGLKISARLLKLANVVE